MDVTGVIFVIDDDVSMCELIEATLRRAGQQVRTFPSIEAFSEGVNLLEESAKMPCCLLLDLVMPGQSGLEFLEEHYGKGGAPCPVIIITARGSVRDAVKSMKLGAIDFLEKPFATEALTALVLETLKHSQSQGLDAQARQLVRGRIASLSPRERELLGAIVQGNSTKMIANRLEISARTVDHHRANLMEKMQATNVADLVRMAMQADYAQVIAEAQKEDPQS
jgi:two-component system, LuxR family, response regulator FixJ